MNGRILGITSKYTLSSIHSTEYIWYQLLNSDKGGKPLYVALAQRKEDRKAHLQAQYMQRVSTGIRMQVSLPSIIHFINLYLCKSLNIGVSIVAVSNNSRRIHLK